MYNTKVGAKYNELVFNVKQVLSSFDIAYMAISQANLDFGKYFNDNAKLYNDWTKS